MDDTSVVGVIQAINKLNNTYFTKDDEGLMLVISKIASSIFRNSINNDAKTKTHNTLRKLLAAALSLHTCKSIHSMLLDGERLLIHDFDIEQVQIYLNDDGWLYRITGDGIKKRIKTDCGIIGKVGFILKINPLGILRPSYGPKQ